MIRPVLLHRNLLFIEVSFGSLWFSVLSFYIPSVYICFQFWTSFLDELNWSQSQVANFEYVDEAEVAAEEEPPVSPSEIRASVNNSERSSFWEDLLRDKYEVHKVEEFNAMGKGKRSRKQVFFVVYWIDWNSRIMMMTNN